MTREEAIKGLKALCRDFSGYKPNEEMFNIAIKVLEQQPCEDAISREDVEECQELMEDTYGDLVYVVRMSDIRQLPPVVPQSKMGKWIEKYHETFKYYCSICNSGSDLKTKFCPNCGAKMKKGE